jgi:hypothetical protein
LETGTCAPLIAHMPADVSGGVFVKLAGYSFRGHPAFDVLAGRIADRDDMGLMFGSLPGRIRWAMHQSAKAGLPVECDIFVWRVIPAETELRLVISDGKLVEVRRYWDITIPPDAWQMSLANHVFGWMRPDLPLPDLLIDLTSAYNHAPLIEVNPLLK